MKLIFGLLMFLVCTTTGCISDSEPEGASLGAGDLLPEFSVRMNTGEIFSTSTLKGKVSVIVFFNTGCGDCRKELPIIQKLWDEYKDNANVEILPVAREEQEEDIAGYWEENGFTMPFSPQDTREIYSLFASSAIPRIYISNPKGVITETYDDSDMPSYNELRASIEQVINGTPQ